MWKDLLAFAGFNVIYATYLELNPKIKGIVVRPDSEGKKRINLRSYFNFAKEPITTPNSEVRKHFWQPKNWDINYPLCATTFMVVYKIISAATTQVVAKSDLPITPFFK